jgi:hypothetical protein
LVGQHGRKSNGCKCANDVVKLDRVLILVLLLFFSTELLETLQWAFLGYAATICGLVLVLTLKAVAYAVPEQIELEIAFTVVYFFIYEVGTGCRFSFLELTNGLNIIFSLLEGFFCFFLFVIISAGY